MKSALDSCRWVRTQLPRFLDGELPEDLRARVSLHLEGCRTCRGVLAEEREVLLGTVATLIHAEPPVGMVDSIFAELEADPERRPVVLTSPPARSAAVGVASFGPALAAAAVLAILLWAIPAIESTPEGPMLAQRDPAISGSLSMSDDASRVGDPSPAAADPDRDEPSAIPSGRSATAGADSDEPLFVRRGDVDANGRFDLEDLRGLVGYVSEGRAAPACLAAADFDEDGEITVHDTVIAAHEFNLQESHPDARPVVFAYELQGEALPCTFRCP